MPDYYKLRIKEIAALSKDYRIWKIHWIGQTSINSATDEMVIDICLVPLKYPKIFLDKSRNQELVFNVNYEFKKRQIVKIGVGQLSLLRVGAIYFDGYPYEHPSYITEEFSFTVNEDNQQIISLGASWGDWGKTQEEERTRYYIPALQYQAFFDEMSESEVNAVTETKKIGGTRKPYKSKCLVLDFLPEERPSVSLNTYPLNLKAWKEERGEIIRDNSESVNQENYEANYNKHIAADEVAEVYGLIIPCIEMARFYYTKSSQLCREILFGGLDSNRVFDAEDTLKPAPDGTGGFLMLSKYVRNKDAPIIARYAFEDYAMSQARHIYASSVNNIIKEKAALPEARFPFRDTGTDLIVHGTYLQSGNRVYFLVFWIESCSAKLPFGDFEFWRTNPGNSVAPETEKDVTQSTAVQVEGGKTTDKEGSSDDGRGNDDGEKKKPHDADTIDMQSNEVPSDIREKINILLNEKRRFSDLPNHRILPRKPKPGGENEYTDEGQQSTFAGGNEDDTETAGTAPGSGTKPITPISITPEETLEDDPPEIEDVVEDNIYDKESTLPDLENFKDEIKEEGDIETEEIFDEDFPAPDRTSKPGDKPLAVNLEVFHGILGWLLKLAPDWQVKMIKVPPDGAPSITRTAAPFPSCWKVAEGKKEKVKRASHLPEELFIAEIKSGLNRYAYLMDIEAKKSETGESGRSFTMFLCCEKPNHLKLGGKPLQWILNRCETKGGKWLLPTETSHKSKQNGDRQSKETKQHLYRVSIKHTRKTEKDYAQTIIKALQDSLK